MVSEKLAAGVGNPTPQDLGRFLGDRDRGDRGHERAGHEQELQRRTIVKQVAERQDSAADPDHDEQQAIASCPHDDALFRCLI